jgi:hypothetical protein
MLHDLVVTEQKNEATEIGLCGRWGYKWVLKLPSTLASSCEDSTH